MGTYWSHQVCGWVQSGPADPMETPEAGHGLPRPRVTRPASPADLAGLPEQRRAAAVPVDA